LRIPEFVRARFRDGSIAHMLAPPSLLPQFAANPGFRCQQSLVARIGSCRQCRRGSIFDDRAVFDHQYPLEITGLANIVGDADQRGALPVLAGTGQQFTAFRPIQATKWFVEDDQPHRAAMQRPAQPYTLPLTAGNQAAAFAKRGLQTGGQALQHRKQIGFTDRLVDVFAVGPVAITQILE